MFLKMLPASLIVIDLSLKGSSIYCKIGCNNFCILRDNSSSRHGDPKVSMKSGDLKVSMKSEDPKPQPSTPTQAILGMLLPPPA